MDELQHKQNLEEEDEVTVKGKPAAIIGVGSPFTDQGTNHVITCHMLLSLQSCVMSMLYII